MIRWFIFSLILCATPAQAAPVLADMSNYRITMDSTFNGTRLFVFGTREENGDVVVVVRGPTKNYVVRKKREIGGVWVNAERIKLFNTPDFYAIAASRPLHELTQHQHIFSQLQIGQENLFASPFVGEESKTYNEFTQAFIRYQQKQRLYSFQPSPLTFMNETLFKTVIDFPDNIPPGTYNAEIYLLKENTIVGTQTLPIQVGKVGMDAFLYNYAHHRPFFYGLTAVVMALSAGWFAGRIFDKT